MSDLIVDDLPDDVVAKLEAVAASNARTVEEEVIAILAKSLGIKQPFRSAQSMLTLWGRTNSINVQKVQWCIEELGLAYRRVDAGREFGVVDTPEYRRMNPNGLVPTIEDDGFVLWESNAIVRYLAAKHGAGTLWPDAPRARADADRWMDWQATAFTPATRPAFHGLLRTSPDKRDGAAVAQSIAESEPFAALLDAHFGERRFVAGDAFTAGDIPVGAAVHRWLNLPTAREKRPNVERYHGELLRRPAAAKILVTPIT